LNKSLLRTLIDLWFGSAGPGFPDGKLLCIGLTGILGSLPYDTSGCRFMDVSGTIGAILNQKGSEIYSIAPDALVFEAIEMMAAKNVGALLVIRGENCLGSFPSAITPAKFFCAASAHEKRG
jgi:hypothetical protein